MSTTRVTRGTNGKGAHGVPVSAEIKRAAERAGIEEREPEAETEEDDEVQAAADALKVPVNEQTRPILERQVHEEKIAAVELTFTLRELCDAVGFSVSPDSFAADALDRIAEQIEAEGKACTEEGGRWE